MEEEVTSLKLEGERQKANREPRTLRAARGGERKFLGQFKTNYKIICMGFHPPLSTKVRSGNRRCFVTFRGGRTAFEKNGEYWESSV